MIVGEPGAGKTTLLKKLTEPASRHRPKETRKLNRLWGINIHEGWAFPYANDKEVIFKANLWDFGGQEIQYMTHHFFLTPRALYVLVADDRRQNTEFDYWFRIINLLGRENEDEKIRVLVVLNEINHESVTNFNHGQYLEDYPGMDIQVRGVDFSKQDRRIEDLSDKVQDMLSNLPQIGDPLPRLWEHIRQELIKRRKKESNISLHQFTEICNNLGLREEKNQRYLSSYLHRLGVMLHYQDDLQLDNFVILRPQWAVDAVYSVLKNDRVNKNHGRFTNLREFWKDYTPDERSQLINLMLKDKFEICYAASRPNEYIAPQLLPNIRPFL